MSSMIRIYIASPYTLGDVAVNVRNQIDTANELMNLGFCPIVPLFSHFHHMIFPRPYEDWLKIDFAKIEMCHALLRLDGESKGADREIEYAVKLGIPVCYSLLQVVKYFNTGG